MKKRLTSFFSLFLLLLAVPLVVFAHSGGTDANGGHYDSSTGEYHYHHGYPAHQHPNGICPYLTDTSTKESSEVYEDLREEGSAPATITQSDLDEAWNDGYWKGYNTAYDLNADTSSLDEAYDEGYGMGYLEGSEEAKEYYYNEGYYDGKADGYDLGFEEAGTGITHTVYLPSDGPTQSSQDESLSAEQPSKNGNIREEILWILLTAAVITVLVLVKAYTHEYKERKDCETYADNWREAAEKAQSELRKYKRQEHYILPLDDEWN